MMTGLKRGTVKLIPHQEEWDQNAKEMIGILFELLNDAAIDIQHVGSTAIQSIHAKPIIDIAVGVGELNDILPYIELLKQHGIIYRGEDVKGLYNPASQEATHFESNELLKRGLESALLQIAEIVYKGKEKVQNEAKFIYVYLRNFMANAVKQYLIDNYELTEDDEIDLNLLLRF